MYNKIIKWTALVMFSVGVVGFTPKFNQNFAPAIVQADAIKQRYKIEYKTEDGTVVGTGSTLAEAGDSIGAPNLPKGYTFASTSINAYTAIVPDSPSEPIIFNVKHEDEAYTVLYIDGDGIERGSEEFKGSPGKVVYYSVPGGYKTVDGKISMELPSFKNKDINVKVEVDSDADVDSTLTEDDSSIDSTSADDSTETSATAGYAPLNDAALSAKAEAESSEIEASIEAEDDADDVEPVGFWAKLKSKLFHKSEHNKFMKWFKIGVIVLILLSIAPFLKFKRKK